MAQQITREELKQKLDQGDSFYLVEVLSPQEFDRLHIKGAINIQFNRIGAEAKKKFGKTDELVLYCADSACRASSIAAEKLEGMGYKNIAIYPGGKEEWQAANLPME